MNENTETETDQKPDPREAIINAIERVNERAQEIGVKVDILNEAWKKMFSGGTSGFEEQMSGIDNALALAKHESSNGTGEKKETTEEAIKETTESGSSETETE